MSGESPAIEVSDLTKTYPFDLAKAKALLAEAGYPVAADVEIFTPTGVLAGLTPRVPLTNDGSVSSSVLWCA